MTNDTVMVIPCTLKKYSRVSQGDQHYVEMTDHQWQSALDLDLNFN